MRIDVVADIVCPWCYIGVRRLRAALAERPRLQPQVFWRPYLLNPDVGPEGMHQAEFLARAFGTESRIRRFKETVQLAGQAVGIDFQFENADFTPFTMPAHRLLGCFDGDPRVLELADALFTAYFSQGRNFGDPDVLKDIARRSGMADEDVDAAIEGSETDRASAVAIDDSETHRLGINGVPSFVFESRHVISGAHDDVVLTRMLDIAAADSGPYLGGGLSAPASPI